MALQQTTEDASTTPLPSFEAGIYAMKKASYSRQGEAVDLIAWFPSGTTEEELYADALRSDWPNALKVVVEKETVRIETTVVVASVRGLRSSGHLLGSIISKCTKFKKITVQI